MKTSKNKSSNLYREVYRSRRLWAAWDHVYKNAKNLGSNRTREYAILFKKHAADNINKLINNLSHNKFKFKSQMGIAAPPKQPGKTKKRPLTISPIEDRVVHRAILDTLQDNSDLDYFLKSPTSFGALRRSGVKEAIMTACIAISKGASSYLRSDIVNFFNHIPHKEVIKILNQRIGDTKFVELIEGALKVEIDNKAELGVDIDLFPSAGIGVAQGNSLSALMGNILLREFDSEMNTEGIVCLRYVDDFLILARSDADRNSAFKKALFLLKRLGLEAYHPQKDKSKAELGNTSKKFRFLGCEIAPGLVQPTEENRKKILDKLKQLFTRSIENFKSNKNDFSKERSFSQTIFVASNTIQAWVGAYSFCNATHVFKSLDNQINILLKNYLKAFLKTQKNCDEETLRRLIGLHLTKDSKFNSIYPLKNI